LSEEKINTDRYVLSGTAWWRAYPSAAFFDEGLHSLEAVWAGI